VRFVINKFVCNDTKYIAFFFLILIISYLATFLGTNSLSVLMCLKEVNQSINLLKVQSSDKVSRQTLTTSRVTFSNCCNPLPASCVFGRVCPNVIQPLCPRSTTRSGSFHRSFHHHQRQLLAIFHKNISFSCATLAMRSRSQFSSNKTDSSVQCSFQHHISNDLIWILSQLLMVKLSAL